MIYNHTITTPANTPATTPTESGIIIDGEEIARLRIYFPKNSGGQVGVQIWHANNQLYPSNRGEYFSGDNCTIDLEDDFQLAEKRTFLTIKTWNTDDTYPHTCHVGMAVLEHSRQAPPDWIRAILSYLPSVLSALLAPSKNKPNDDKNGA